VVGEAIAGPVLAASGVRVAFGVLELVIFASWALLFAVLIGMLMYVTLLRGRRERRRLRTPPVVDQPDPHLPARLAEMRNADPHFDEQLLRDAARMACLVIFAAMATGDEQAIRRLAVPSFWSTVFGRYVKTCARDARVRRARGGTNGRAARQARLPVDYQASAPELIDLGPGSPQRARVRVSFSQLMAMIAPGAEGQAAMATATSLSSLAGSFGQAMGERMNNAPAGLDWLSWDGQYDLAFTRPAGSRTDPSTALASRTCTACGRAYRSELVTACEYCRAERPAPWGQWRLADVTVVDE
jgi:hypothetical protein